MLKGSKGKPKQVRSLGHFEFVRKQKFKNNLVVRKRIILFVALTACLLSCVCFQDLTIFALYCCLKVVNNFFFF